MKNQPFLALFFLLVALSVTSVHALERQSVPAAEPEITEPLFKPFIERYILDELKQLRQDQQAMRADVAEKVAEARLNASDRAIRYTADTTNNIFYIITAAASMLVLLGWKSIQDIKQSIEATTTRRVEEMTLKYEERLKALEITIKERSEQIVAAQQEISDSNVMHSLWMRAGLEKSDQEKIHIYDQILEINPNDVEALTYKADTLLDMDEDTWALSLVDQALEKDPEYALAYWQRACAKAKLEQYEEALEDIERALALSASLRDKLAGEVYFTGMREHAGFLALSGAAVNDGPAQGGQPVTA
ncbi:MAG: tetratricopeptide repeat protein [Gammaproteobacteria bacterium]